MNFSELENIMEKGGIVSLANIARVLNTTPQAVSNWKARDQVPYHIVNKINNMFDDNNDKNELKSHQKRKVSKIDLDNKPVSLSDFLLIISQQLKIVLLIPFIFTFLTFTYIQFIKKPLYESSATILLPQNASTSYSGISGIASQFGVNMPTENVVDLSSPTLYPELLTSRTFADKVVDKEVYLEKYGKKISILAALTYGDGKPKLSREMLISQATKTLNNQYIQFNQFPKSSISTLKILAPEPRFAQDLANIILIELDSLNRFFKSQNVKEKTFFIDERISTVSSELSNSESRLKNFKEKNRQILSPSLQLDQDRLARDVEVKKSIYLTLKQQLELSKIEEVQQTSIVQILDRPQLPMGPSNKNLKMSLLISLFVGFAIGIILALGRAYMNSDNIDERKKLKKIRSFFKKKSIETLSDRRISGTIILLFVAASPFYFGYKSHQPIFFGRYSLIMLIINCLYLLILFISTYLFFSRTTSKR